MLLFKKPDPVDAVLSPRLTLTIRCGPVRLDFFKSLKLFLQSAGRLSVLQHRGAKKKKRRKKPQKLPSACTAQELLRCFYRSLASSRPTSHLVSRFSARNENRLAVFHPVLKWQKKKKKQHCDDTGLFNSILMS